MTPATSARYFFLADGQRNRNAHRDSSTGNRARDPSDERIPFTTTVETNPMTPSRLASIT